ncbi:MAG: TetR/AcrR family transcriptional regulator [Thermoanaerobaculia bacterium]|nr:TetR/AcrR family transcriptional regulator [Thermoanaerobaculia bacterium]
MKTKEQVIEEFRVESIREAAMRVIARKGIAGASMQEIADEAGVAKGTIYLYFRNQKELLEAAVEKALDELSERIGKAFESEGTFAETLELLIRSHLEFFADNYELFQVHLATKYPEGADSGSTRCDRFSRTRYHAYLERLSKCLEKAMERGEIREGDPRRLALFIQEGMVAVLLQRMTEETPPAIEEEIDWILQAVLNGLSSKGRRGRKN